VSVVAPRAWLRRAPPAVRKAVTWVATAVRGMVVRSMRDDIAQVASQFAYNGFLATVPTAFVLVALARLLIEPHELNDFLIQNEDKIPVEIQDILTRALASANHNTNQTAFFLAIGLVGALYILGNVMGSLIGGLDRVRDVEHRPFLRNKVVSIAFAAMTSFLVLVVVLGLIGGPPVVGAAADRITDGPAPDISTGTIVGIGSAGLLVFTLLLYRYAPNAPRRTVLLDLPGTFFAVGLWLATARLFALYLDNFESYDRVYGSLGTIVVYLLFLFLTGISLLLGAELNQQLIEMRRWRRRGWLKLWRRKDREAEERAEAAEKDANGTNGTSSPSGTVSGP
jgi:membrane protein